MKQSSNYQEHSYPEVPASIPELTHRHLDALRDACEGLDVALDEHDEGNIEHCTQQVQACQESVTEILTTW